MRVIKKLEKPEVAKKTSVVDLEKEGAVIKPEISTIEDVPRSRPACPRLREKDLVNCWPLPNIEISQKCAELRRLETKQGKVRSRWFRGAGRTCARDGEISK
jgi:hypothetical protein